MTDSETLSVKRYQVLSGSALKLIACFTMLCDHLAKFYLCRFAWFDTLGFSFVGRFFELEELMLLLGRLSFPLFAFLLVVGFEHTRDKRKYALSLFVFALISEIPYNLMIAKSLYCPLQNVMFTLLMGCLAMWNLSRFKQKPFVSLVILGALLLAVEYMNADYGMRGLLFILVLYGLRDQEVLRSVAAPVLLLSKKKVFVAMLLTLLYNGKRGFIKTPFLKYCFYAFYPVHMLLIYFLSRC